MKIGRTKMRKQYENKKKKNEKHNSLEGSTKG